MKTLRYSNLGMMLAALSASMSVQFGHSPHLESMERRAIRSATRRHQRFYNTYNPVVRPVDQLQANERRRRHIAEGRYPRSQILRNPVFAVAQ